MCSRYPSMCSSFPSICSRYPSMCSRYRSICSCYRSMCSRYRSMYFRYRSMCSRYPSMCSRYPSKYFRYPSMYSRCPSNYILVTAPLFSLHLHVFSLFFHVFSVPLRVFSLPPLTYSRHPCSCPHLYPPPQSVFPGRLPSLPAQHVWWQERNASLSTRVDIFPCDYYPGPITTRVKHRSRRRLSIACMLINSLSSLIRFTETLQFLDTLIGFCLEIIKDAEGNSASIYIHQRHGTDPLINFGQSSRKGDIVCFKKTCY